MSLKCRRGGNDVITRAVLNQLLGQDRSHRTAQRYFERQKEFNSYMCLSLASLARALQLELSAGLWTDGLSFHAVSTYKWLEYSQEADEF